MGGLKGFRTGGLLRFLPLCVIFVVFMENISCKMVKEGHKQLAWGVMLPTYFLPTQQGNTPNWLPPGRHYPYHLEMVVPAIRIATEKVKREYLPGRNITVQIEDTKCDLENTQFQAAEMEVKFDKKVYAYFGPVCEYPVAPVSRFAKRWNIPLITVGAQAFTYHQARMIINFMPPHVHLGRFVYEIWEKYHWTRGVMLYHKNDKGMEDPFFMMGAVYKGLQLQGPMNFSNHGFDEFSNVDYTQILRKNVMPESRGMCHDNLFMPQNNVSDLEKKSFDRVQNNAASTHKMLPLTCRKVV
ncbi:atrial natriuretic peptide receptor 3-like [Diadema setosum]|uniref:atrial natriuretic peptide receptor 3-like n=1 Tax=Diadema setosum TaxID=31175 RepID=UPI003B3A627B